MAAKHLLDDLSLAALVSSRICHDIISPVGAIANGLEVLDEEDDENVRAYALDLIRKSTEQASAKLQFARLAYGAGGSAASEIDMDTVERVIAGIIDLQKHKLTLSTRLTGLQKDKVRLLLNLVAIAITTLPRGGTIDVLVTGDKTEPVLEINCSGQGGRVPDHVEKIFSGHASGALDTMSIQPYYANRLAISCNMVVSVEQKGNVICIFSK